MNITKTKLEDDLHALKGALKHAGYSVGSIIEEWETINGKWSDRDIKERAKREKLRPGAQATLDKWDEYDEKALGNFKETG